MIDLTTTYLGLTLKNPVVASAGPLSESLDNIRRLAGKQIQQPQCAIVRSMRCLVVR